MSDLRPLVIRLASTLPKGSPERKALLATLVTADVQTPLMKAADDILVDVAKALASKVDGKLIEFKPTHSEPGSSNPGYASGGIEVVLPVFPSISSQPASLGISISTGEAEGLVRLHVGPLYGTLHNGPEQKLLQTFPLYKTGLEGAPEQVHSKLNAYVAGLLNVLQPSIAKETELRAAHQLFEAAVPGLKQTIAMALKPLGMTDFFTHGPGAASMVDGLPFGRVRLTAQGLLTDPSRDAARAAYAGIRKALVKALSRFSAGNVRAKVSSEPGFWSAMAYEGAIILYLEGLVPSKVASGTSREELLQRVAALPKGSAERKELLAVLKVADDAQTDWATMIKTKQYVDEELAPAANYSKQVSIVKSLQAGDKVEVTYNDNQRGGLVKTLRVVSMSWADLQAAHPGAFTKPEVLLAPKGAIRPGNPKGGMITDYGMGDGVVWQPSMMMPVRSVVELRKV